MKRFFTSILFLSLFIFFTCPLKTFSQTKTTFIDCTWWVHKPVLKSDSSAILSRKIKRIDLYELTSNADATGYDTVHYGKWNIIVFNGKITRSDWFGSVNDCFSMDKVIFGEDKIVEQCACQPNSDDCVVKIVSILDKGKITETQNKNMSDDTYLFFKIKYEYKNDLPVSASYYSDKKDDSLYKKIVFVYSF